MFISRSFFFLSFFLFFLCLSFFLFFSVSFLLFLFLSLSFFGSLRLLFTLFLFLSFLLFLFFSSPSFIPSLIFLLFLYLLKRYVTLALHGQPLRMTNMYMFNENRPSRCKNFNSQCSACNLEISFSSEMRTRP